MKINIGEIPERGLDIDEEEDLSSETAGLIKAVSYRLKVEKLKTEVLVRGEVRAGLGLQCGRCLKNMEESVSLEMDLAFVPAKSLKGAESHELRADEMKTGFYSGDELDLNEVTKEQVLLSLPMKPLCSESCKGLCPACGADLNLGDCGCDRKAGDRRFQALEKLLKKGRE